MSDPVAHGRVLKADFRPARWLPGPHLQTIWPMVRPPVLRQPGRPERLELPDGDFLDLVWFEPDGPVQTDAPAPLVCILHGLEGSIASQCIIGVVNALTAQGAACVFMHFRGCSEEPNRLPRSYHSGETGDPRHVFEHLAERFPGRPVHAVGYSLGANVLLKYLGERGTDSLLTSAVAVSVPFLLAAASVKLTRGFARIYQRYLLRSLKRTTRSRVEMLRANGFDVEAILAVRSIRDFDDKLTAPLHGFESAEDYYSRCSSRAFLKDIQIPTLILHAKDDPFMYPHVVPEAHELSVHVQLELCESGGHVGFVGSRGKLWLPGRISRFVCGDEAMPTV